MRLRNVPGAREVMIENEYVFTEPEGMKGTWSQVFGNDNPIRIEIGMGKGTFITTLAANNLSSGITILEFKNQTPILSHKTKIMAMIIK